MSDKSPLYSFWDHLEELRSVILRGFWLWLVFFFLLGSTYSWWLPFLTEGAQELLISEPQPSCQIINQGPGAVKLWIGQNHLELAAGGELSLSLNKAPSALYAFSPWESLTVSLKASIWLSTWVCLPFWALLALSFIQPALTSQERRLIKPSLCALFLCWLLSSLLSPHLARFLSLYLVSWTPEFVEQLWGFASYVDFLFMMLLACAACFLLIAFLFLSVLAGWISYQHLKNAQKGVILGSFILGAILTPPDVLSQVAMASVLLFAYYAAMGLALLKKIQRL